MTQNVARFILDVLGFAVTFGFPFAAFMLFAYGYSTNANCPPHKSKMIKTLVFLLTFCIAMISESAENFVMVMCIAGMACTLFEIIATPDT